MNTWLVEDDGGVAMRSAFLYGLVLIALVQVGCSKATRFTLNQHTLSIAHGNAGNQKGDVGLKAAVLRHKQLVEPERSDAVLAAAAAEVLGRAGYRLVGTGTPNYYVELTANAVKIKRGITGAWVVAEVNVRMQDQTGRVLLQRSFKRKQRGSGTDNAFTKAVYLCLQDFYYALPASP